MEEIGNCLSRTRRKIKSAYNGSFQGILKHVGVLRPQIVCLSNIYSIYSFTLLLLHCSSGKQFFSYLINIYTSILLSEKIHETKQLSHNNFNSLKLLLVNFILRYRSRDSRCAWKIHILFYFRALRGCLERLTRLNILFIFVGVLGASHKTSLLQGWISRISYCASDVIF